MVKFDVGDEGRWEQRLGAMPCVHEAASRRECGEGHKR